eukprot:tig00020801_g13961.t1
MGAARSAPLALARTATVMRASPTGAQHPTALALRMRPGALLGRPVIRTLASEAAGIGGGPPPAQARQAPRSPARGKWTQRPRGKPEVFRIKIFSEAIRRGVEVALASSPEAFEPAALQIKAALEELVPPPFREAVAARVIHELATKHSDGARAEALVRSCPALGVKITAKHFHPVMYHYVCRDDPASWRRAEEWLAGAIERGETDASVLTPGTGSRPVSPCGKEEWPLLQSRAAGYVLLGDFETARRQVSSVPEIRRQVDWAMLYATSAIVRRALGLNGRRSRDPTPLQSPPDPELVEAARARIRAIAAHFVESGPVYGNTRNMARDWARRLYPALVPPSAIDALADLVVPPFEEAAPGLGMDLLAGFLQGARNELADPAPVYATLARFRAPGSGPPPARTEFLIASDVARNIVRPSKAQKSAAGSGSGAWDRRAERSPLPPPLLP